MPEPNTKQFELQKAVAIALALATGLRKDPYHTIFDVWCGDPLTIPEPAEPHKAGEQAALAEVRRRYPGRNTPPHSHLLDVLDPEVGRASMTPRAT